MRNITRNVPSSPSRPLLGIFVPYNMLPRSIERYGCTDLELTAVGGLGLWHSAHRVLQDGAAATATVRLVILPVPQLLVPSVYTMRASTPIGVMQYFD